MADHEKMLRDLLGDIAEKNNYKDATIIIKPTNSGGANYTSILFNATVTAPNKKKLHLFVKVANLSENTRSKLPTYMFDIERFVYKDLTEVFRRIEVKCEVPEEERFVLPKLYGYNQTIYEETIVLENLAAQGYVVHDRFKSIDWPYASKAVEAIAKFHALAIAYGEQKPDEYDQLLKKLTKETKLTFKTIHDNFKSFLETALSETREENKERLQKYFERESSVCENLLERYYKPNLRPVIIHSDFRASNVMHRVNNDGSVDLIVLDYQTIQAGCGVTDLLYFIFSGSDAQFRAQYYQRLVDHYYDSLSSYLLKLRLDPDKLYPRADFDYELREAFPYGLLCGIFLLPVVTVETEYAPDLNDDKLWEDFKLPKTGPLYHDRLNGVIDDYIRWGIL